MNNCPEVSFTCCAPDIQESVLVWEFDETFVANYALSPGDSFPRPPDELNNEYAGNVNISITCASLTTENRGSFQSIIYIQNISLLHDERFSIIICGSDNDPSRRANITFRSGSLNLTTLFLILSNYNTFKMWSLSHIILQIM